MKAPSEKRIIFHLGYHKTGSSSIQFWLRDNYPQLSRHIALYSVIGGSADPLKFSAQALSMGFIGPEAFLEAALGWAERFSALPQKTIVFTDESLPGLPLGAHTRGYRETKIYPDAPEVVRLLAEAFREFDPVFVVFEREKQAWLRSLHHQLAHHGSVKEDFDGYIARYRPEVDWPALRHKLEAAVEEGAGGRGRLVAYSFEEEFARASVAEMGFFRLLDLPDEVLARCAPTLGKVNSSAAKNAAKQRRMQAARGAAGRGQRQLTPAEIELAYELFLGRTPNSAEVARMVEKGAGIDRIRRLFLSSPEFASRQKTGPART